MAENDPEKDVLDEQEQDKIPPRVSSQMPALLTLVFSDFRA